MCPKRVVRHHGLLLGHTLLLCSFGWILLKVVRILKIWIGFKCFFFFFWTKDKILEEIPVMEKFVSVDLLFPLSEFRDFAGFVLEK